ncbi:MAG: hypothetical protein ACM3S1_10735 [Hyphomicrobiales bacterium]
MATAGYSRKVSSEEAREGYLLVEKRALGRFFPQPGAPFPFADGAAARTATVESTPCTCRGPEKPHEHYFVRVPGLVRGERVTVHRDGGGYRLERE